MNKHGLERDDQIKFYNCFPESPVDLSPTKRGPKSYIPPRFKCPTPKCSSVFSRKYDLLKHLRQCNDQLIETPEVCNLKDAVIQHC